MTPGRSFHLVMFLVAVAAWLAPSQLSLIQGLDGVWWWPATSLSLVAVSLLGFRWMTSSRDGSPMQFVNAVNGTTAMKLFTALGWITAYLVTQETAKKEFAFSTFAVFLVCTVSLVVFGVQTARENKKAEQGG